MAKYILGKKIGMTQLFNEQGKPLAVTLVTAGPCVVTQLRTLEKDGYAAAQMGFGTKKHLNKAQQGHFKDRGALETPALHITSHVDLITHRKLLNRELRAHSPLCQ